jgi:hypothetical protein
MSYDFKKYLVASWLGFYSKTRLRPATPVGYIAPLGGIWAAAPYLHNGSVPTLYALLHIEARPKVWVRSEDGYDPKNVGLEYGAFKSLPVTATTLDQEGLYYQTDLPRLGNQGHRFPMTSLNATDTTALLEYLKSL